MSFKTVPEAVVASAQGIDVSNHNPVLSVASWRSYHFGFAKATESTNFRDVTFPANWRNMKAAGVRRGAYHFFHPAVDPIAQAKYFASYVQQEGFGPGDMLCADVEITSGGALSRAFKRVSGNRQRNDITQRAVSLATVDVTARAFLDELRKLVGSKNPIVVYTNLSVGAQLVSCTGYPLWIAWPSATSPASVKPWSTWKMWQWGMTGVDRDAFNGTTAEMDAWINSFVTPPSSGSGYPHYADGKTTWGTYASQRNMNGVSFFDEQVRLNPGDALNLIDGAVPKSGARFWTMHP